MSNIAIARDAKADRVLANGTLEELGATREQALTIRLNGWKVVNAPRPILGAIRWTGPFGHGTFYAAGPASYERMWHEDDAWEVLMTTNLVITEQLVGLLGKRGRALGDVVAEGFTIAQLAGGYGLPWRAA